MSCPQFGYNGSASTTQLLMAGQSAGQQLHGTAASTGQPCCESGRPVMTDPLTGQTVCSCQYDAQLLNYQRLAASGIPLNMYGTAAAAAAAVAYTGEQGFLPLSAEQSAFYSPSANGFDLKDNLEAWRSLPYAASMYYPYDSAALAGYPFPNGYGVDLNGARRKNATRETTSTLKAWLNEHRKNPYPTKGEKIMLAIITKMTLTQVSTWFANARRRLKKENKMTWSPRNRCEDDDADVDGEDVGRMKDADGDNKESDSDVKDGGDTDNERRDLSKSAMEQDTRHEGRSERRAEFVDVDDDCKSCASGSNEAHLLNSSDKENCILIKPRTSSPVSDGSLASDSESSQASVLMSNTGHHNTTTDLQAAPKPRIWSIVDTATSNNTVSPSTSSLPSVSSSGASRLSPLQRATRLDYLSPYPKPSSWYAGTLGSISVATSGVAGSFPLSAVYTCPPMVPPASALSSMAHPVSSGTTSVSGALTESSAVSSLNRLRTAAASFPSGDLSLHKVAANNQPSVFNLSTRLGAVQPSGSAAAIAAVAGASAAVGSSCPPVTQSRVMS